MAGNFLRCRDLVPSFRCDRPFPFITFILLLFFTLTCLSDAPQSDVNIVDVQYFEDTTGAMQPGDFIYRSDELKFLPVSDFTYQPGQNRSNYWLKITVDTEQQVEGIPSVLMVKTAWTERQHIYQLLGDNEYREISEAKEQQDWHWLSSRGEIAYPVFLESDTSHTFLVSLGATSAIRAVVHIDKLHDYVKHLWRGRIVDFLLFGVIVLTIVYSIFINLSTVSKINYTIYSVMLVFMVIITEGVYVSGFLQSMPFSPVVVISLAIFIVLVFSVRFYQSFLNLKQKTPKLHRVLNAGLLFYSVVFLLVLNLRIAPIILCVFLCLTQIGLLLVCIGRAFRGELSSLFLAMASLLFLVGVAMSLIVNSSMTSSALYDIPFFKLAVAGNVVLIWVALVTDIHRVRNEHLESEQNLAETTRQNAELKSALFSNLSHELLTPMNGVFGALSMLKDEPLSRRVADALGIIKESSESVYGAIRVMLTYMDYSNPDCDIEYVPNNLKKSLSVAEKYFRKRCDNKHLSLQISGADDLPEWVMAPKDAIANVVGFLLSNAVKFTDHGGITLDVNTTTLQTSAGDESSPTHRVSYTVSDTGNGIAAEELQKIFQPFHAEDTSIIRPRGGLGMGLAIAKLICEQMGATISCSSEPGRGSKFVFSVDVKVVDAPAVNAEVRESGEQAKALVVDDNTVNLMVISRILRNMGCEVITAENGQQAVDALQDKVVDIVFMDCQMPVMDGLSATRKIRELQGGIAGVPIVAITANVMSHDRKKCLESGMSDYIEKPVEPERLRKVLRQWIGHTYAA